MKPSTLLGSLLLTCCLASTVVAFMSGGGGGGGGRRYGSGADQYEVPGDEVEEEEVSDSTGADSRSELSGSQQNTGYTIKQLFGANNNPASPTYPRKTATGDVDTKAMYAFGAVPKSPERIRLRGNRTDLNPNEGRVEVEHRGSWGLVCDGHFGDTEANVACKSLGFRKGANKYYSDSFFGTGQFKVKDIVMSQVKCSQQGDETDLNQCTHSHMGQCLLNNTAGVECNYNEGCPWGWVGYDGLCYRVIPLPKTPDEAADDCVANGGNLAYVLSEGENNFLSNVMYTQYKNLSAAWTAGQFANVEKGGRIKQAWVFKDSDHVIRKDKTYWFPGFADGSSARPTTDEEKRSCLALSKIFFRRDSGKDTEVNYFWWDNVSCKTRLPYICQKLAVSTDCYNGTGKDYAGRATRTEDGSLCENWGSDNPDLQVRSSFRDGYGGGGGRRGRGGRGGGGGGMRAFGPGRRRIRGGWSNLEGRSMGRRTYGYGGWDSQDHNYCRNADGDKKPWCWINKKQSTMGYCNIRQCGNITKASAGPPKGLNASFNSPMCQRADQFFCPSMINYRPKCVGKVDVCDGYRDCVGGEDENATFCKAYKCKKEEFYCSKIHRCIPTWRVCDKNYDCDYGDDETEAACKKYKPQGNSETEVLKKYAKTDSVDENSVPETMSSVTYFTLSLFQCQAKCDRPENEALDSCAGFLFSAEGTYGSQCVLVPEKLPSVTAGETATFTYYEKMQQTCDTSTHFACKNGHCVAQTQKCNGYDDCGDFSDEIGPSECPDPKPTFEVRLSSGKGTYEGRIEVKLFKEWGLVCDDSLDASLGDLVCRQLGFPQGQERLIFNAKREFGRGSGKFLMSSAKCAGVTTSLFDCSHPGWRSGNCSVNNVAGLVCRRQRACTIKEFRCSDRCVPLSAVCDRVADCPDGADEAACAEMKLALRNGNSSTSGVLEITRGGISGAICDDTFTNKEVKVACRQLGLGSGSGQKLPPSTYKAPENLVMWVQDLKCTGTEASLFACNAKNWGKTLCDVSEAVNIECAPRPTSTEPPAATTTRAPTTLAPGALPTCGQRFGRFPAGRIVNGYPAIAGQFPWQVGIRLRLSSTESQQWCGGTIISDRWIVTASHCFEEYPKSAYILRIGDLDNTVKEPLEREFDIDLLIKHEKYSGSPAFDYDITLLRVKPDRQGYIAFHDTVQPACLPDKNLVVDSKTTTCHVSGWGSMGTMDLPKNLMAANVPLIENAKCNEMYAGRISERMQCAGFEAGGIDSCQGDSGGPLVCKVNERYVLLGATSWGEGCALPNAPGVYANVRNLRDWIDQTIRKNP